MKKKFTVALIFDRFSKCWYQNLQKIKYYDLDKKSSFLDKAKGVKIDQKFQILDFGKYFWAKFKVFDPIIIKTFFILYFSIKLDDLRNILIV